MNVNRFLNLSKYLIFEISRCLTLISTLKLGGVCKELHRKIHYQNAMGDYICLRKTGEGDKFGALYQNYVNYVLLTKYGKSLNVIEILLKAGADINFQDHTGKTALMKASLDDYDYDLKILQRVKLLLKKGADTNIQDNDGYTALLHAARIGYDSIVRLLLKAGADVDIQDNNGNTALILVSEVDKPSIVKILLEAGADIDIQNNDGETALALGWCYGSVVKIFTDFQE